MAADGGAGRGADVRLRLWASPATVLGLAVVIVGAQRANERVHVRQYEAWGPAFLPAYTLASIWAVARGGHFYLDIHFEREAFDEEQAM